MTRWLIIVSAVSASVIFAACGQGASKNVQGAGSPTSPSQVSSSTSPGGRAPSPQKVQTRTVSLGELSLQVPASWKRGKQFWVKETPTTLPQLLPKTSPDKGPGITSDPRNQSPFFIEQLNLSGAYLGELSANGEYYSLRIKPTPEVPNLNEIVASIKTPPLATATDVVKILKRLSKQSRRRNLYTETRYGAKDRWLLTGGNFATAEEQFALYRSTNGGTTWSLEQHTTFRGKDNFMGLAGTPTIFFWSAKKGLIVEASGFSRQLLIYRTTDGGTTWTSSKIGPPKQQPDFTKAPGISRRPDGTLVITAKYMSGKVFEAVSSDGGKTWSPAS